MRLIGVLYAARSLSPFAFGPSILEPISIAYSDEGTAVISSTCCLLSLGAKLSS